MPVIDREELDFLLRDSMDCGFRGYRVYYQPQVHADSGRLYGAEALARWSCGRYGLVGPDQFIPVLEENGYIDRLNRWIFGQAAAQCGKWCEWKSDFHMSVNLSCRHIGGEELFGFMDRTIRSLSLSAENFTVELTESWPLYPDSTLGQTILALKKTGLQIAMDDFGSGYSSLLALKRFPFDLVKIDRGFVSGMLQDKTQAAFVPALTSLVHNVGRRVCLEGVETMEEYEAVQKLGIEVLQGYYFGKPVPAEVFEDKYLNSICGGVRSNRNRA